MPKSRIKRTYRLDFTLHFKVKEYPDQINELHDELMQYIAQHIKFWTVIRGKVWLKDCETGRFKGCVSGKQSKGEK